jgi:hypothetical protein
MRTTSAELVKYGARLRTDNTMTRVLAQRQTRQLRDPASDRLITN